IPRRPRQVIDIPPDAPPGTGAVAFPAPLRCRGLEVSHPKLNARTTLAACAASLVLCGARAGFAQKIDPDGITQEQAAAALGFDPRALGTSAVPDIYGPGHVLSAGRPDVKVTNFGHVGNFFTNTSSDPAGQWPGGSGVEYLSTIRLAVGAKDPTSVDPSTAHRVSYFLEWRPPTLDPVDRIYEAYEGIPNGARN